jgi:molecular chaperone GrpE
MSDDELIDDEPSVVEHRVEGSASGEAQVAPQPEADRGRGESEAADEPAISSAEPVELTELEIVTADRDDWRGRAQRIAAEFENYRKRVTTQHGDDIDRATGRLAESLLPVLDACEAAFLQHPAEVEPLFNVLLSELKKQGLETMNLHEQPFDPTVADAVLHEPNDEGTEPVVSEVLRSGYIWKGKVLRPAMVKVRG